MYYMTNMTNMTNMTMAINLCSLCRKSPHQQSSTGKKYLEKVVLAPRIRDSIYKYRYTGTTSHPFNRNVFRNTAKMA